jgi:transposase
LDQAPTPSFEKACDLNLKENSSGTQQGGIHLTKRGPGVVRRYLFLLAIRLIGRDPIICAWYEKRRSYQGENKLRSVVAVMRKLTRALWHVAKGAAFDSQKLFDVRRVELPTKDHACAPSKDVTHAAQFVTRAAEPA